MSNTNTNKNKNNKQMNSKTRNRNETNEFQDSRMNLTKKVENDFNDLSIDEKCSITKLYDLIDSERDSFITQHNITQEQFNHRKRMNEYRHELKLNIINNYISSFDKFSISFIDEYNSEFIKVLFDDDVVISSSLIHDLTCEYNYNIESISFDKELNKLVVVLYNTL